MNAADYEAQCQQEQSARYQANGHAPIGRVLPHSLEAEEHLLSACMLDGDDVIRQGIEAGIKPESFYEARHGIIFATLLRLHAAKQPTEVAAVAEELQSARQLDVVGGIAFLTQVSSRVPTTATAGFFIEKVREQATLREIIRTATGVVEDCYGHAGDLGEFLAAQQARLEPLFRHSGSRAKTFTVWSPAQLREWTPPMELNLLGAGYVRRRQITTLIGPPGVGKSRLSLWLAVSHIAGRPWCGLDPKGGPLRWFMLGNENDPERQKHDMDWFYRSLTKPEKDRVDANLSLHILESHEDAQMTLIDPAVYARLVTTLKMVKPDVFVCDPWGNMIEGSESDDSVIRMTLKLLLRAVSEGAPEAAIIIIHHARTGKLNTIEAGNNYSGGNLGRGSKVLVSQARCELALWPGDREDSTKLVLTCEKVNNAPKFDPIGLLFENGIYQVDSAFSPKSWRDDIEGKRSRRILTVGDILKIVGSGAVRAKEVVEAAAQPPFGATRSTVYERVKEAIEKGYLSSLGGKYCLSAPKISRRDITEPKNSDSNLG